MQGKIERLKKGDMTLKKGKFEIDMCNGSIMDKLISFALPLMASSILQLMFNAVDIIVVGRFSGRQALAAVGSTTALINIFTNLFIGISLGANVLAAGYFASGKKKEMSEAVHTAIGFALISGICMAFVGVAASHLALQMMDTPADVIGQSTTYMRIYFMGMPFFMLYNYGAAVLRAVGDTKRPLLFLIVAGAANVGLDLLLVIVIPLDVAGVAIGTVASQMVSCILVLWCLHRTESSYQLRFSRLSVKWIYLKRIFQVGVPAGIQSTVINFSNAMLQSSVNSFGATAMAGYTATNNILGFLYVCSQCDYAGVYEFYQPELQCWEAETNGPGLSGLCDLVCCSWRCFRHWSLYVRTAAFKDLYFRWKCNSMRNGDFIDHNHIILSVRDHGPDSRSHAWNGTFCGADGLICDRNSRDKDCMDLWIFSRITDHYIFFLFLIRGPGSLRLSCRRSVFILFGKNAGFSQIEMGNEDKIRGEALIIKASPLCLL